MGLAILLLSFILFLLLGIPAAYSLGFSSFIAMLFLPGVPWMIFAQRMASALNSFPLLAIPLFILAGNIMNTGGVTNRLFSFARSLVGHWKGGLGHVNVLASMIFSGMSGAALADVAGLGAVEIKAMDDQGYPRGFSAAVTAATSTIGPIIPPSIPFVLYGVIGEVSVGQLFAAGAVPGLVMGALLMLITWYISVRRDFPSDPRANLKQIWRAFANAIAPLMTIVIIIGGILGGIFTPTEAAAVACVYALGLAIVYKEMSWKRIYEILLGTVRTCGTILLIYGTASMFGWLITFEKVPEMVSQWMLGVSQNPYIILLIINIVLLIMGMFLDINSALLISMPVFIPLITTLGIDPVYFGVVVILNLMIGGLTPPFAMLSYVVCNVARVSFEEVTREALPYLVTLLAALLIVTMVPQISLWLPTLLMR